MHKKTRWDRGIACIGPTANNGRQRRLLREFEPRHCSGGNP